MIDGIQAVHFRPDGIGQVYIPKRLAEHLPRPFQFVAELVEDGVLLRRPEAESRVLPSWAVKR